MREQPLVDPPIASLKLFRSHVLRPEDGMARVIQGPVAMQDAAFRFHLAKQRGRRIWSEDVEGGALQTILFNPLRCVRENIFAIVIETEDERAVHLDAVVVENAHTAGIL